MLCPHKVTKSQCHLAEKNNQHTPKIFMGYCTGAAGFRDLLSSTLAQSSVLNTGPSAPSLPCSNDSHQHPNSKKNGTWSSLILLWGSGNHCRQGIAEGSKKKWGHEFGSTALRDVATAPAERKAGLAWLFCLSKAHTWLLCRDYSTEQEKGEACLCLRKTHVQVLLQHITALLFTLTPE